MKIPLLSLLVALPLAAGAVPNILFVSIDDLNDWTSGLGGHPQAATPALDALAARGTLFTNAHCQAPVCAPSRFSLMTGRYPESTGLYFLSPENREPTPELPLEFLPHRFARAGYTVKAAGKLFHNRLNQEVFGALDGYGGPFGGFGPTPKQKISQPHGHPLWDWGAFPERDDQMPDHKITDWAVDQLRTLPTDKPFFLGVGFYRPHVPMFAPKKWFDKFPRDTIQLPEVRENDLDDLSPYAISLTRDQHVAPTHQWMQESGEWPHAVQAYLASVAFADHCLGRVLEALDNSPHADNTLVVAWSDHGFHLGEKDRWAKRSLWEDSTRVQLAVAMPGQRAVGHKCSEPVELIDLYPTLMDLCGLDAPPGLEGQSLRPLVQQLNPDWPHLARTSFGPGNIALKGKRFRYIRYVDGSEELYDHRSDPHEWTNLAGDPEQAERLETFRERLPTRYHPALGKRSTGHHAYRAAAEKVGIEAGIPPAK